MPIDQKITAVRTSLNLTPAQAARRTSLSYEAYQEIESGHRCPTVANLLDIAAGFGRSVTDFLDMPDDARRAVAAAEHGRAGTDDIQVRAVFLRDIEQHVIPLLRQDPSYKEPVPADADARPRARKAESPYDECVSLLAGLNADGLAEARHQLRLLARIKSFQS